MDDLISRQAAIDVIDKIFPVDPMRNDYTQGITCGAALATEYIKQLPSAQPQPCKDAVSKADVLETYAELYDVFDDNKEIKNELHKIYDKINALKAAQPQRMKGRWIHDGCDIPHGVDWMHCSVCGRREPHVPAAMTNFCPSCGSDMRGEENEVD